MAAPPPPPPPPPPNWTRLPTRLSLGECHCRWEDPTKEKPRKHDGSLLCHPDVVILGPLELYYYYNPKRFPLEKRSPLFFWDMPDVSSDVGSICYSLPLVPSDLDGNSEREIDRSGESIHTKNLTIFWGNHVFPLLYVVSLKVVSNMT